MSTPRLWNLAVSTLLLLGPALWLLGNAASDVWLGFAIMLGVIGRVASATRSVDISGVDISRVELALGVAVLIFFCWGGLSAALSMLPAAAASQIGQFARFPIFACALYWLLKDRPDRIAIFMVSCLLALLFASTSLGIERWQNPRALRLESFWGQGPYIGTFIMGLGLMIAAYAWTLASGWKQILAVAGLLVLITATAANAGEVYTSALLVFGIGLILLLTPGKRIIGLAAGGVLLVAGFGVIQAFPVLWSRMVLRTPDRLPWRETSDYFPGWFGAVQTGLQQPVTGVGPGLFNEFCQANPDLLSVEKCLWHPHQIYLQIFAEMGLVGLAILMMIIALLFVKLVSIGRLARSPFLVVSLILLVVSFWPISTFGNAFGQLRNFYLWLVVGFAFSLASVGSPYWPKLRFSSFWKGA